MYHSESGFLHGEVISLLTEAACLIGNDRQWFEGVEKNSSPAFDTAETSAGRES